MLKSIIKKVADLFSILVLLPIVFLHFVFKTVGRRDYFFSASSQFLSLFPGLTGSNLRKNYYRMTMTRCSGDCAILFGTLFFQSDTEIGKHVYIGAHCNIGSSVIEDYCTLGSNVHILSGKKQHFFDDLKKPVQEQGGVLEKIRIGEDTWIGNGAIVMANVGRKCVIGAGSVVTRELPDYCVVAGNPARIIRSRKSQGHVIG
jgi:virginiamycin A acetyltransferase